MIKMLVHLATGEFRSGGFAESRPPITGSDVAGNPIFDPAFVVVDVPGEQIPDRLTERYDATQPTKRRAATAPEIAAFDTAERATRFAATSRQKDVLATCALIVRARGIAAWNGMSVQQKRDAALAEADVWSNVRDFIEQNL